jgi:ABC-type transporter MlaC component
MSQRWKTSVRWMRRLAIPLAVLLLRSSARPVRAAEPQERRREILHAVAAVLKDPTLQGPGKPAERQPRVRQIILDTFDFEEMAKLALGPSGDRWTPQQRTEFGRLFGHLCERSYHSLERHFLAERPSTSGRESITQDRAVVQTPLVDQTTSGQLPIEYRLMHQDQRWAVYDGIVDGVSLALNYPAPFAQSIQSASYDTLRQRIKRKVDEGAL